MATNEEMRAWLEFRREISVANDSLANVEIIDSILAALEPVTEEGRKILAEHLEWIFERAGLTESHQCSRCRRIRAIILGHAAKERKEEK